MAPALIDIHGRLVDLLPIPGALLPPAPARKLEHQACCRIGAQHVAHEALPGVRDGGMAMDAYLGHIPTTTSARKAAIHGELLAYCALDTLAMVKSGESSRSTNQRPRLPVTNQRANHAHATRKHTANTVLRLTLCSI